MAVFNEPVLLLERALNPAARLSPMEPFPRPNVAQLNFASPATSSFTPGVLPIPTFPSPSRTKGVLSLSVPSSLNLKEIPAPAFVTIKATAELEAPDTVVFRTVPVLPAPFPVRAKLTRVPLIDVEVEVVSNSFPEVKLDDASLKSVFPRIKW